MNELNCPRCEDIKLIRKNFEGTPVELCEECGGIWLNKGDLNKIAHPISGDIEYCSQENPGRKGPSTLECPVCKGVQLARANFIEFSDIMLDVCPECHGIWLDKGELEAINAEIDALAKIPESWDHRVMAFISKLPF
ncbi:MAG: zf-TFIIB domain-containing protein [Victivallales bacterium]|nr:zf-TFIIB domain-containing protein [Victivallales bacterium]